VHKNCNSCGSGFESDISQLVALPDENNGFYQISEVNTGLLVFFFPTLEGQQRMKNRSLKKELLGTYGYRYCLTHFKCSDMRTEGLLPEILCDTRDRL
jgi:hypothetical protein